MYRHAEDDEVAVHRGGFVSGSRVAEYYTSQPACTQWIAVGVVSPRAAVRIGSPAARLLVGTGRTERAAVRDLAGRLARLAPAPQPACPAPPVPAVATPRSDGAPGVLESDRPIPQRSLRCGSAAVQAPVPDWEA